MEPASGLVRCHRRTDRLGCGTVRDPQRDRRFGSDPFGDRPMTSPLEQKLKITGPVVVTANRLGDGAVVYRTMDGDWSTALAQAAVVDTAPAATTLLAAAIADDIGAVGAYVAPVCL